MEIDFEKLTTSIKQFVIFYVQAFVGILTSPAQTFPSLINSEGGKFPIIKIRTLDTKPFIYAAISLVIGLLLGSSLLVKNAPSEINGWEIIKTIIPYLFLWLLYGLVIHYFAKLLKGTGKIEDTISSVFYVLGTLHPLLILIVYITAAIYPDSLIFDPTPYNAPYFPGGYAPSYDSTLRDPGVYATIIQKWETIDLFGKNFFVLYFLVSFTLTAIYLYFPISYIHKFSLIRVIATYLVGFFATIFFLFLALIIIGIFIPILVFAIQTMIRKVAQ